MTDEAQHDRLIVKPRYAIAIAILLFCILIFLLQITKGTQTAVIISDLLSPLLNCVAAILLLKAARSSKRISNKVAKAWSFFAAALFSFAAGDLLWGFTEIVLKKDPFPSTADFGYIVFYILFLIGTAIISFRAYNKLEWLKHLLDLGIIAIATGIGFLNFIIQPLSNSLAQETFQLRFFSLLYPVFDLILITAIFWLINSDLRSYVRLPILFLVLGATTLIITDTLCSVTR